jgi:exosortase H (IPTLxxWG-CTERM-specific)
MNDDGIAEGEVQVDPDSSEPRLSFWENPAYRFFLALVLGTIALNITSVREIFDPLIESLARGTATVEYFVFALFTQDISIADTILSFKGFDVIIVEECTGIYEAFIYGAAVLAFPTSWKKKGIGLGVGVPVLYIVNIARIAVLLIVGHYQPHLFEFMHLYFWQVTLVAMILSVWLVWAKFVVVNPRFD